MVVHVLYYILEIIINKKLFKWNSDFVMVMITVHVTKFMYTYKFFYKIVSILLGSVWFDRMCFWYILN